MVLKNLLPIILIPLAQRSNELRSSIVQFPKDWVFLLVMVTLFGVSVVACRGVCEAQTVTPVLFYSDLDSGPSSGGEANNGAFVCLYGEHFGNTRRSSSVRFGSVEAAAYKLWSDPGEPYRPGHYAKACVQVPRNLSSGTIKIQLLTSIGKSNSLDFTVRPGNIYFVSSGGNDKTGDGSIDHPWLTVRQCKNHMSSGDVCYIKDGVTTNSNENYGSAIVLSSSGEPGRPKALVAYPGAFVTVDNSNTNGAARALTNINPTAEINYWTIAGMTFNSSKTGIQLFRGSGIRLVDNDIMCTGIHCNGYDGGLSAGAPKAESSHIVVLGNRIHDVGCHEDKDYQHSNNPCAWVPAGKTNLTTSGRNWNTQVTTSLGVGYIIKANNELRRIVSCDADCRSGQLDVPFTADVLSGTSWQMRPPSPPKFFHNVYFGHTNSVDFGWNEIDGAKGRACRGLLFHSTGGRDEYDLHVHDNDIHDTACDCLAFGTVDPTQGPVEAFNNTLHSCGVGSDAIPQSSFSGVYVANNADCLPNPNRNGKVKFYNNTVYNAGPGGSAGDNRACFALQTSSTSAHATVGLELANNICFQLDPKAQTYLALQGNDKITGRTAASYVSGSSNDCFGLGRGCPDELGNSLSVLPGFLDAANGDFRLSENSRLRTAGDRTSATSDQDGKPRRTKPSVGAF